MSKKAKAADREKSKGGRPSKILRPELRDRTPKAIRGGAYMETAAAFAGVSKVQLYEWLRFAEERPGTIYDTFRQEVEQAMAQAEISMVLIINRAAQRQWQAAAWRLERMHSERYGRSDKLSAEITGKGGAPIQQRLEVVFVDDPDPEPEQPG